MGYLLQQSSTSRPLLFLMVQSSDHITGLTGASPTVTISKNGASFASPAGAVTEVANGWYKVAGNATDNATTGPLLLHATAASGDPCDVGFEVVAFNPDTTAAGGIPVVGTGANNFKSDSSANVTFANTSIANLTNAPTAGDFTATMKTSLNAATPSVTVSDKTGFSLSGSQTFNLTGNITGNLSGSVGSVTGGATAANQTTINNNVLANFAILNSGTYGNAALLTAITAVFNTLPRVYTKDVTIQGHPFPMKQLDGDLYTGAGSTITVLAVTGGASPGTFTPAATPAKQADGGYTIDIAQGETNYTEIMLICTASGAQITFDRLAFQP